MTLPARIFWMFLTTAFFASGALRADEPSVADMKKISQELFVKQVQPIFSRRCVQCHGPEEQESGLRVDLAQRLFRGGQSGAVIERGDPAASLLFKLISTKDGDQMPPDDPLSKREIQAVKRWIQSGAEWPRHIRQIQDARKASGGHPGAP